MCQHKSPNLWRIFVKVNLSRTDCNAGKQDQTARRRTTGILFYAFQIKEKAKERLYEGERKQGIDWITGW